MEHNSKRIIVQATQFPFDIDYLVSLSWRCGSWEAERLPLLLPGLLQSKMEFRYWDSDAHPSRLIGLAVTGALCFCLSFILFSLGCESENFLL
jgi:hypothetical protein